MKKSLVYQLYILLLLPGSRALSQGVGADSSWTGTAITGLRQHYTLSQRNNESLLYNGPEYVSHLPSYLDGYPFFQSAAPLPATIEYGGTTYDGVPLRYDLMLDLLIVHAPLANVDIELISDFVSRFTVDGHTFIRIVEPNSNSPLRTGFYDLLVDGPVRVLAGRQKTMQKRSRADGMEGEITQKNVLYIRKDNRYYPANSASQLLTLFPEQKAALRKYIKAENLKFREAHREEDVAALIRYQALLAPPPGLPRSE